MDRKFNLNSGWFSIVSQEELIMEIVFPILILMLLFFFTLKPLFIKKTKIKEYNWEYKDD